MAGIATGLVVEAFFAHDYYGFDQYRENHPPYFEGSDYQNIIKYFMKRVSEMYGPHLIAKVDNSRQADITSMAGTEITIYDPSNKDKVNFKVNVVQAVVNHGDYVPVWKGNGLAIKHVGKDDNGNINLT